MQLTSADTRFGVIGLAMSFVAFSADRIWPALPGWIPLVIFIIGCGLLLLAAYLWWTARWRPVPAGAAMQGSVKQPPPTGPPASPPPSVVVNSYHQSGGITANAVNVSSVPPPRVTSEVLDRNVRASTVPPPSGPSAYLPDDWTELFVTRVRALLLAQAVPAHLRADVRAASLAGIVLGLEISGQMLPSGHHIGVGQGWTRIDSPSNGTYLLHIFTRQAETDVHVDWTTAD